MKKGTKIWLLIAGVCVGLGLMLSVIGVLTGAKSGLVFDKNGLRVLQEERYYFESERVKDIQKIKVNVYNAALEVLPSEDDTFRVVVDLFAEADEIDVRTEGDSISVVQEMRGWRGLNFGFLNFFRYIGHEDKVTVYVPAGVSLEEVNMHTSNGSIDLDGRLTVNTLKLDTSNGAIRLADIRSRELTDLHTSNGRIECRGEFAGRTDIKTSNGKVVLSGIYQGSTRCKTSNGAIEADLDNARRSYNISAETSNGSIRVDGNKTKDDFSEDNRASNSIDFDTSNGSITLNFGS